MNISTLATSARRFIAIASSCCSVYLQSFRQINLLQNEASGARVTLVLTMKPSIFFRLRIFESCEIELPVINPFPEAIPAIIRLWPMATWIFAFKKPNTLVQKEPLMSSHSQLAIRVPVFIGWLGNCVGRPLLF